MGRRRAARLQLHHPRAYELSALIFTHTGGFLNPDSWKIFTPVSLRIRTAKLRKHGRWIETSETFKNCPVYPFKPAHIQSDLASLILAVPPPRNNAMLLQLHLASLSLSRAPSWIIPCGCYLCPLSLYHASPIWTVCVRCGVTVVTKFKRQLKTNAAFCNVASKRRESPVRVRRGRNFNGSRENNAMLDLWKKWYFSWTAEEGGHQTWKPKQKFTLCKKCSSLSSLHLWSTRQTVF